TPSPRVLQPRGGSRIPSTRVTDLRGRVAALPAVSVLVDTTGRRARRLRIAGRVVAALLALWLCGLLLAGLGLLPLSDVPFGNATTAPGHDPTRTTGNGSGKTR